MQQRQQHVGHRRAVGRLEVQVAAQVTVGAPGEEQRASLVVVHVGVPYRRPVDDERLVEEVAVPFLNILQLLEEVGYEADVVFIDLRELRDAILALAVVRRADDTAG